MSRSPRSAAIVGAGVVGVATAYALARRGVEVTVIEGREAAGRGASYANGAQLSYLYTDALANPRLLGELHTLLLGRSESFRMRMSLDPDYLRWLLAFLRNCTTGRFRRNTLAGLELGLESRLEMARLLESHDVSFGYAVRGKMHLYHSEESFAAARRVMDMKNVGGSAQRALTPNEALAVEPALEQASHRPVGVVYTPEEAVGDSFQFATELLRVLQARYGVRVLFGTAVEAIRTSRGRALVRTTGDALEADVAVVCAGADARRLLRPLGRNVRIIAMKGYSLTAPPGDAAPSVSLTDTTRRLVFTNLGDRIRVAGLADLGWRSSDADMDRMSTLLTHAKTALPFAADFERAENLWAGLRPMTPDSLPRIGKASQTVAYNVGHGMLGWTLSMGSAERLASMLAPSTQPLTQGRSAHDLEALATS